MRSCADRDTGAALLLALLAALMLAALGGGLLALGDTEASLAHNHRSAAELLYAADAVVERSLTEMRAAISWTDVLTGAVRSPLSAATSQPVAPWGGTVDLLALTTEVQTDSDAVSAVGMNNPSWRVFAAGAFDIAAGGAMEIPQAYVVLWVADDPSEIDNNPAADTNDVLLVRGLALNALGMRVNVQVTARRVGGVVKILAWRLVQ
jgi:hypothetical protein